MFLDQLCIKSQDEKKMESQLKMERQCGSGRPAKIMTKSGINQHFDHQCGISQHKYKLIFTA